MANFGPVEIALILGCALISITLLAALAGVVWRAVRPPARHGRKRKRHH